MLGADLDRLGEMKEAIERIEEHALHLRNLGKDVPAVEKNARNILTAVYLLKFGISDIVDIQTA
jgi:hypothetical protein